jgi:glycosyltransferase involved in cell wall biosynthesis
VKTGERTWVCAQIGAREHYAIPRALHRSGRLAALVTDWYAFQGNAETLKTDNLKKKTEINVSFQLSKCQHLLRWFQRVCVSAFQRFGGRSAMAARCSELPDELVHAFPVRSLLWKWQVRRLAARGRSHEAFIQTDAAFASAVARCHLPPHDVFFGYSYASLETLAAERQRGALTVLDQIDPGAAEFRLVAEEMARFPELAGPPPPFPGAYYERNRREWELADRIIVNSRWSYDALVNQGVPPEKLVVVPLCFEKKAETLKLDGFSACQDVSLSAFCSLRVLFLGQVNVRKGIHYLMEAARLLERENIRFDVVGPVGILPGAAAAAPVNMTFHGPVSRDCAEQWYERSDVFVLPTLSDGFALTQIEAMAHGLPVIATPNCGEVVSDGLDGFIVPARDAAALAGAIRRYLAEPGLLESQRTAAFNKSGQFTLDKLGERLKGVEQTLVKC